jgi:autotransporter family porin
VDIDLQTGSHWTGASLAATNVTVDPTSQWTIPANSVVTQDVFNAGLIEFTPPAGDPTLLGNYKTLTTTNYLGAGGTIGLNTFLGTDGSPSDKLVINGGAATGGSSLRITNTGGPGALTVANGILVVETIHWGSNFARRFRAFQRRRSGTV